MTDEIVLNQYDIVEYKGELYYVYSGGHSSTAAIRRWHGTQESGCVPNKSDLKLVERAPDEKRRMELVGLDWDDAEQVRCYDECKRYGKPQHGYTEDGTLIERGDIVEYKDKLWRVVRFSRACLDLVRYDEGRNEKTQYPRTEDVTLKQKAPKTRLEGMAAAGFELPENAKPGMVIKLDCGGGTMSPKDAVVPCTNRVFVTEEQAIEEWDRLAREISAGESYVEIREVELAEGGKLITVNMDVDFVEYDLDDLLKAMREYLEEYVETSVKVDVSYLCPAF